MTEIKKLKTDGEALLLALQIEEIKKTVVNINLDFLAESAKDMVDQASWQESAAVINRRYNPEKPDTLRVMGETLRHLHNFITGLKKCDEMKAKVAKYEAQQEEIEKLFT